MSVIRYAENYDILSRKKLLPLSCVEIIKHSQSTDPLPMVKVAVPCGSIGSPRWYCVRTRPQGEYLALKGLSAMGFQTYLPLLIDQRRLSIKGQTFQDVVEPLFPRYLFIAYDPFIDPWERILGVRQVEGFLRTTDGKPMVVPIEQVRTLLAATVPELGAIDLRDDKQRQRSARMAAKSGLPLQVVDAGTMIRMKSGPWAEFVGIVESSTENRLTAWFSLFGRESLVTTDRNAEFDVVGQSDAH